MVEISSAIAGDSPSVTHFSPQGTVKQVRQVTARFSEPMVALGDPRDTTAPFEIDCPAKGAGRWIDSRNWSYDFEHDLPAGLRCTFKLRAGLKSLAGNAFSSVSAFNFDTGGPSIVDQRPWSDSNDIDEEQAFVLILDAEPDPASILEHAGFSVEDMPQTVGATIMSGADRDILLKRFANLTANKTVVILQAKQRFPNNAAVTLIWGKGIKSKSGIATDQDQTISYKTRKRFEASIRCERESAKAGCIPLTPITVSFTSPISAEQAKQIALIAPDGAQQFAVLSDPGETSSLSFKGPFKESSQYKIEIPPNLVDGSGRELANASRFPMTVETGEFPPLAKFSARFGIIESADAVLPVTVRNLEAQIAGDQLKLGGDADSSLLTRIEATLWRVPTPKAGDVLSWLNRVAEAKRAESVFSGENAGGARQFAMPKPNGPNAFEVMGIPLKRPGLYIVELKSTRLGTVLLGAPKPMYVPTAALVTNLAVHFKQGQANSLVWVTALESGRPVDGADVAIADCHGTELWTGRTDARGLAMVPTSSAFANLPQCDSTQTDHESDYFTHQVEALNGLNRGLLVTAQSGEDFSFVHSSWQQGIEAWRFHLPTEYQPSPYIADTVFDRTLLRAGETVHMKHFIRAKTVDGLSLVPKENLPDTLSITFSGGDQHYDFDLKWNDSGSAENDWQIPKAAKLGTYDVTMSRRKIAAPSPTPAAGSGDMGDQSTQEISTGNFRVEEFRIPLMKAAIRVPTQPLVAVTEIPIDLSAEYLSGGAAKGLPVTLRSQINKNASAHFDDFDDFVFANGIVTPGIVHSEGFSEGMESEQNPGVHQRKDLTLDAAGGARTDISDIPRASTPTEVHAELEYRDPNGESQTVSNNVMIWPAKRLVGIQVEDWASSPGVVRAHLAVVDDSGKPIAHAPVRVDIFSRLEYSYRKRLIGGFYAYENTQETKLVGALCSGVTDDRGRLSCEAKPPVTGQAILQATVTDDAGNSSSANSEIFIPGNEREWFAGRDDDRMDFIPEKPAYEPGDVARFQVRMPFAEATALVTVEREGVLAASIVHLPGRNPVITLPVRDWAPNVFVSALVVRGRIAGVQPTAMLDLGKPAFKLGIAEIRVGWRDHRLNVKVAPEKSVYHVRDKASVKISVRTFDGKAPAPGSTIAVAAVDEGLARAARQRQLETARRDDGSARVPGRDFDRRDASRRQAPLWNQGNSAGRRRWSSDYARTVRHAAAMEGVGRARCERRRNDRSAAQRLADQFQNRRDRQFRRRSIWNWLCEYPFDSRFDVVIRSVADHSKWRFVCRRVHCAQCVGARFRCDRQCKDRRPRAGTAAAETCTRTRPRHDHLVEGRGAGGRARTQVSRRCERRARTVRSFADHSARYTCGSGASASGHAGATRQTNRPAGRAAGRRARWRRRRASLAEPFARGGTRRSARLDAPISLRMPRATRVGRRRARRSEIMERNHCGPAVVYRLGRFAQILSRNGQWQ